MLGAFSKAFFHTLSQSGTLKRLASRYGMSGSGGFARRFIASETLHEAIDAARVVEARGLAQTLDYLGESVSTLDEADAATREYLTMIDAIVAAGIGRNISLKLTQLGLDVDEAQCLAHLRTIVSAAAPRECFVRIDMENSPYVDRTLTIFETFTPGRPLPPGLEVLIPQLKEQFEQRHAGTSRNTHCAAARAT